MSQQYPQQPGGDVPPPPGWGAPQQGWGTPPPPPQPPKKSSTGKILGFGCLGVVALVIVIGVIAAVAGGGGKSDDEKADAGKSGAPSAASSSQSGGSKPAGKPAAVEIIAKKASFTKSVLADGDAYTSVSVIIRNNSGKKVSVNPLYFTVTDTNGTKHTDELGVDDKQIDTVDLSPGENISGTVTGKGAFTPKYVTFTEDLFGDPVRVDVK
ncbi:conserved protein of unknown function [Streptomyces murinus]|uniref:DUF4352 domain-containing protein n=1 Tax=Streptomyces murinus TaxID=33900 RepID=UPI003D66945F